MNKTLVVDIGGTHVKLMLEGAEQRQFDSGSKMQPADFTAHVKENTRDWKIDNISIGFPSVRSNVMNLTLRLRAAVYGFTLTGSKQIGRAHV